LLGKVFRTTFACYVRICFFFAHIKNFYIQLRITFIANFVNCLENKRFSVWKTSVFHFEKQAFFISKNKRFSFRKTVYVELSSNEC